MASDVTRGWTVQAVLSLLGAPAPDKKGYFCCPVHVDRHPSCHIVQSGRGWTCFSCGGHGGILDLIVALGAATDLKDAAKFLESV